MTANEKALRELAVWLTGPDMDWQRDAACARPENAHLPWTADVGEATPAEVGQMARACARCLVRPECAVFARTESVSAGCWAGRERGHLENLDLLDELATLDAPAVAAPGLVAV
ncbi:hypothetical protein [Myceligenerans pegani]|uniref:4Fe-4S Wbl-type domain-containing protein n=1 Tax=Myceligenerans pegani TaxID=2776917 RepID=A0ABR9MTX7_9MICO|nr:hypothetical protein [Myceligenerans sp. TRM 65318]MBE1874832.1 hypothetical protein [Myceligenerans sp. TRM 65318]MBE3017103.1 hypothetical protein [Myceligenerans sp. TRM 65318]